MLTRIRCNRRMRAVQIGCRELASGARSHARTLALKGTRGLWCSHGCAKQNNLPLSICNPYPTHTFSRKKKVMSSRCVRPGPREAAQKAAGVSAWMYEENWCFVCIIVKTAKKNSAHAHRTLAYRASPSQSPGRFFSGYASGAAGLAMSTKHGEVLITTHTDGE